MEPAHPLVTQERRHGLNTIMVYYPVLEKTKQNRCSKNKKAKLNTEADDGQCVWLKLHLDRDYASRQSVCAEHTTLKATDSEYQTPQPQHEDECLK